MNVIRSVNVADSIADNWSIDNITEWTSDEETITGKHIASISYLTRVASVLQWCNSRGLTSCHLVLQQEYAVMHRTKLSNIRVIVYHPVRLSV